jgi:sugar phosphate isomerase/epimerase
MQTRRDFNKALLAGIPAAMAYGANVSKFDGVQIGIITYSFRTLPTDQLLPSIQKAGIGEIELMSNHAEALVGAPVVQRGPGGAGNPSAADALRKWRSEVSLDAYKGLRKKLDAAGVETQLLCFNLNGANTDDEIDYSFQMAKALGVNAITCSTKITVARRVAPFADKYKIMWGAHGHDRTEDPDEFATPESFATVMSLSKYMGVNLDIGHFTAANYDAVAYIKEHHDRITNIHLKDRKRDHGANLPWGQGDTPIKQVLQLMRKEKYAFPANVEYEYMGKDDPATEVAKCIKFCKDALV